MKIEILFTWLDKPWNHWTANIEIDGVFYVAATEDFKGDPKGAKKWFLKILHKE